MKGEIVVYTIAGCPHCSHAKKLLREHDLTFKEVSVDENKQIREFLLRTTGKTSVPQIFFNGEPIGGNENLQSLIRNKEKWNKILLDVMHNETKNTLVLSPDSQSTSSTASGDIVFACEPDKQASVITKLINANVMKQRISFPPWKKVSPSLTNEEFIKWFLKNISGDFDEAKEMLVNILQKKYLVPVNYQEVLNYEQLDSETLLKLNDGAESDALNAGTPKYCKIEDITVLSEHLRKQILIMYSKYVLDDGSKVNYKEMKNSPEFIEFLETVRELQHSPIEKLNENEKKAFFINIYNVLVIHGVLDNGHPKSMWSKHKFYSGTKYILGGYEFSLDEIEHGILRSNSRTPTGLIKPFSVTDPRKTYSLSKIDPRIHFALNCGAKSCPPIKVFSAEDIDEELDVATQAFLELDESLYIQDSVVYLTSLFKWYTSDFGGKEYLGEWLVAHAPPDKKKQLQETFLDKWKFSFNEYDWSSNSVA